MYDNERHKNAEGTENTPELRASEIENIKQFHAYLRSFWYQIFFIMALNNQHMIISIGDPKRD